MRIAMVFDGLQIGGVERVGLEYAKISLSLGHDITIINLVPKLDGFENEIPKGCRYIKYVYSRKEAPEQYTQLVKRGNAFQLASAVVSGCLSLVNGCHKALARSKSELRQKFDIAIAFSGHFNDLSFVARGFVRAEHKMCWLHGALYSYALISDGFLRLYNRISNLIVLVDDAQEEVKMYNPSLNVNINKLYNPTSISERTVDKVKADNLKAKYGDFAIMVSRFSYPHKDHYTVVSAFEILHRKYGANLNVLFLGDGPEEQKVKKYVDTLSPEARSHIFFLGSVYDVQNYYTAAKMLIHASVAGEGLPTIMLEALAYKLPMVVTDSKTGPREILRDNEYGLLCEVQNPEDMAEKVNELITNQELYKKFQEKSSERLRDFEVETISKRLSGILENIVERR